MDPLSISVSVLAIITAAVQATNSLCETVQRFKDRNKTLGRLQAELVDLANILGSLTKVTNDEASTLTLLQGPIERCSQVCQEFEQSMKVFSGKSKTGFRDWAKMEFMRGDINEFIDTIAGYKSTITVGLGTITMLVAVPCLLWARLTFLIRHTSKISHKVLQEYNEMIRDTAYNLELHLQRIEEKMTQFTIESINASDTSTDLKDEREVTKQCLRVCEEAKSFIESLSNRESSLLQEAPQNAVDDYIQNSFEALLLTRQALDGNRNSFADIIGHLQKRLESLVRNEDPGNDNERSRLQADVNISKQCLDVCKVASEVSRQKVYRIGEVVADDESDQVVVTTLADLFDIKKALSRNKSAQLVGSMTAESLRHLIDQRYHSRFGAVVGNSNPAEAGATGSPSVIGVGNSNPAEAGATGSPSAIGVQKSKDALPPQIDSDEQSPEPKPRKKKPSSNQMRKRVTDDAMD
jgi:hypothetical protein